MKQLTGGDTIRARRMREDFWQFQPTHTVLLGTNRKPHVRGTDHAIWRRLALVPFTVRFWDADKGETGPDELNSDKGLKAKLEAERPGILAWLVRGCGQWQRQGLDLPESVKAATKEYRSGEDIIWQFVTDCCLTMGPVRVKFSELYDVLRRWCDNCGEHCPTRKRVATWLKDQGYDSQKSGVRWYSGIGLKAEMD